MGKLDDKKNTYDTFCADNNIFYCKNQRLPRRYADAAYQPDNHK
jgi:hypothetical protein